jgi:hypothetical protein
MTLKQIAEAVGCAILFAFPFLIEIAKDLLK